MPRRPQRLSDLMRLRHSAFSGAREEACLALLRTGEAFAKREDRLLAPHGLTTPQFNLLMALRYEGRPDGLSQATLGKLLLVSRANMSVHIRRLSGRGLVRKGRAPESAREHRITLTPAGRRLLEAAEPAYNREVRQVMGALGAKECRVLCDMLGRLWAGWVGGAS